MAHVTQTRNHFFAKRCSSTGKKTAYYCAQHNAAIDPYMFRSSCFSVLVFGHFWPQSYENTKILRNHCLHFAREDGQDGKKQKENHATEVTKISKTN